MRRRARTALLERGRALRRHVPKDRARDWDTLLAGFTKDESEAKRRARVEGLLRACELFKEGLPSPVSEPAPLPPVAWDSSLSALVGVGPKTSAALSELGISRIGELLWLMPVAWQDLTRPVPLRELAALDLEDARVVVTAEVKSAGVIGMRGRKTVRVAVVDGSVTLSCFWFFLAHGVLNVATPGARVILAGRVQTKCTRRVVLRAPGHLSRRAVRAAPLAALHRAWREERDDARGYGRRHETP